MPTLPLSKQWKRLRLAYSQVFNSQNGKDILLDLSKFASDEKDPAVRAGRMDVIARILKERSRLGDAEETE